MTEAKSFQARSSSAPWYSEGIRFECSGSGKCCVSHGEYGYVYVTKADRRRMADQLGLATSVFTRRYCKKVDGLFALKDQDAPAGQPKPCVFLAEKRCGVYSARPTQCRTWPFWPETLVNQRNWKKDVASFCPGVGKGALWTADQIQKELSAQVAWENNVARAK